MTADFALLFATTSSMKLSISERVRKEQKHEIMRTTKSLIKRRCVQEVKGLNALFTL